VYRGDKKRTFEQEIDEFVDSMFDTYERRITTDLIGQQFPTIVLERVPVEFLNEGLLHPDLLT
jgi:hypothetical protein